MPNMNEITVGFQVPNNLKLRKEKLDELLRLHEDIGYAGLLGFLSTLDENGSKTFADALDEEMYDEAADCIRETFVRDLVRGHLNEFVRKKHGGGFVVYKPKKPNDHSKKHGEKASESGNYAVALRKNAAILRQSGDEAGAARYEKRANKEAGIQVHEPKKQKKGGSKKPATRTRAKKGFQAEDFQRLLSTLVNERLFREENVGSEWDEYLTRLSSKALEGDSKFKNLQKKIEKTTEGVLEDAFNAIKKAVGKVAKLKASGVKKGEGKTYLTFSAAIGDAVVEPIYVYAENGVPHLELSPEAEQRFMEVEPDAADMFRGKLAAVQEKVLSKMKDLIDAVDARDAYLEKLEDNLDGYVSDLTPLQMSLLKVLLVKKYRKV